MEKAEKSIKRWLKKKIKVTLGMMIAFLITGNVSFAEINEYPQPNKDYNDLLVYNGTLDLGDKNYVFNFNGGLKLTQGSGPAYYEGILLGHDTGYGDIVDQEPDPNYKYDQVNAVFNVGKASNEKYDFSVTGTEMALHIAKKDSLTINGEGTNLHFKVTERNQFGHIGTIEVETYGKLNITANSMLIEGQKDSNIRIIDDAKVNINLTDNFISQKGESMIQAQNYLDDSDTIFNLTAKNIIGSSKTEGFIEQSIGIYSVNTKKSNVTMNLTAKENIDISGYDYGVYSYGVADINLKAQDINIAAVEYGIYAYGNSNINTNGIFSF